MCNKETNITDRGKLQRTMSGHQEMPAYDDNSVFGDLTQDEEKLSRFCIHLRGPLLRIIRANNRPILDCSYEVDRENLGKSLNIFNVREGSVEGSVKRETLYLPHINNNAF